MKFALKMLAVLLGGVTVAGADIIDWGPLWYRQPREARCRVLGPLWERDGETDLALRPFYSRWRDPRQTFCYHDFLWPAATVRSGRDETNWRVLLAYGDYSEAPEDGPFRLRVFPFFYRGRDDAGNEYAAVFPLGGEIRNFLGRDEIYFVLFPLWARSSVKDVETLNVLWPVFSRSRGGGVDRLRVFPLYGRATREDRYEKRFIMWPIWNSVAYGPDGEEGGGYILFPLWGRIERGEQESLMLLPPFFRFHSGPVMDLVHCPWPFFQYSSGDIDKLYVWPLWGRRSHDDVSSWFAMWPLLQVSRNEGGRRPVRSTRMIPFYHSRITGEEDPDEVYRKVWPLLRYHRGEDELHWRALALWPLKSTRGVERLWAPWWTLAQHRREGERRHTELLWGMVRHVSDPEHGNRFSLFPLWSWSSEPEEDIKEWSILKGLIGYKGGDAGRRWRLLYFLNWGAEE